MNLNPRIEQLLKHLAFWRRWKEKKILRERSQQALNRRIMVNYRNKWAIANTVERSKPTLKTGFVKNETLLPLSSSAGGGERKTIIIEARNPLPQYPNNL